jgi:hypothetical protein
VDFLVAEETVGYGPCLEVDSTSRRHLNLVPLMHRIRLAGAALGLIAIFLPGMLILLGALPFWESFRKRAVAQAVMRSVNAAVVGLLAAALYNPLWTSSVRIPGDFGLALVGFVLLSAWRAPPLLVHPERARGNHSSAYGNMMK